LPNLLVSGMKNAIKDSGAKIVYVCNLMTKFGQTNHFTVSDFILEIEKYLGKNVLDYVIYNTQKPNQKALLSYKKENEFFVNVDKDNFKNNYKYIPENLLSQKIFKKTKGDALKRSLIRHDPVKLAKAILNCK
jgi:uncharacterized cofD-like protein